MYQGRCLCGAVQFELTSMPVRASHCCCRMCQRQHGAAFATYASADAAALVIADAAPLQWYWSSASVRRGFCKQCGSSLFWQDNQEPQGLIAIAMAAFDTAPEVKQIPFIYQDDRAPWCPLASAD